MSWARREQPRKIDDDEDASTTWAIAMGVRGAELPSHDRLAGTAILARRLADDHALPERERIVDAAEAGWDLGIRTRGDFWAEVTASRDLEGIGRRLIVTAQHDRRATTDWMFFWSIQPEESTNFSVDAYASGSATSFAAAIDLAIAAAERTRG